MLKLKTGYLKKQCIKSGIKNNIRSSKGDINKPPVTEFIRSDNLELPNFQMAMLIRNGIFICREIQRDRKIPYRYQMQIGQEVISYNILTYLPSQKKLENLANRNHETPDLRPEGTKFGNSSIFVISRCNN